MDSPNTPGSQDGDGSFVPGLVLLNRQRAARVDGREVRRFLGILCSRVSKRPSAYACSRTGEIRSYNKRFRQQDKATDVLSFPAAASRAEEEDYLGDVLISVETARDNAACYGWTLEDEIKVLALHGVLHLMGYDHETDSGKMAREERSWCARLGLPSSLTIRSKHENPGPDRKRVVALSKRLTGNSAESGAARRRR